MLCKRRPPLLQKATAVTLTCSGAADPSRFQLVLGAVCSAELTRGGTSHGRRLTEVGHAKAMLGRCGASTQEVRALHTLCKALERRLASPAGS